MKGNDMRKELSEKQKAMPERKEYINKTTTCMYCLQPLAKCKGHTEEELKNKCCHCGTVVNPNGFGKNKNGLFYCYYCSLVKQRSDIRVYDKQMYNCDIPKED